jgi:hypothetical protein
LQTVGGIFSIFGIAFRATHTSLLQVTARSPKGDEAVSTGALGIAAMTGWGAASHSLDFPPKAIDNSLGRGDMVSGRGSFVQNRLPR